KTSLMLERATVLARESGNSHALGFIALCHCLKSYLEGRWTDGGALGRRAIQILRDSCTGVHWEINSAQTFSLWCMLCLGDLNDLRREYPLVLAEARERGDLYTVTYLGTVIQKFIMMTDGRTQQAREELHRVKNEVDEKNSTVFHFNLRARLVELALY